MKTYRFPIILAASLLSLVACGGGNGGNDNSSNVPGDDSKQEGASSASIDDSSVSVNPSSYDGGSSSATSQDSTGSSSNAGSSSDAGGSSSIDDSNAIIKEETNITIWTTYNDSYQAILNNAIDEFQKMEPHVHVNNVKQQGSYDDLKTMVVNGFAVDNYPDIVAAYPDSVADFINNFKALDIEPYMTNSEYGWTEDDLEDIPESIIEAGQHYAMPGTYSLPCSKSTEAMYYNQDVLVGLNLAPYDATINNGRPLNDAYLQNLTWEELFEKLVPALDAYDNAQSADNKIIDRTTYADWAWVGYDSDDNLFITLAEQYGYGYTAIDQNTGKGIINFNNPEMKALMKKFAGYNKNHYFTTKGVIKENVNYRSTKDAMLFSIGSTGGVKYQFDSANAHNVGVAMIPQAAGKAKKVISQGPDFAFLDHENENRAIATWLFYKLFTSTKYNSAWALASGYSPIRLSVMETKEYLDYADVTDKDDYTIDRLFALNATYAVNSTEYFFTSPVFKGSSEARNQVGTIYAACVTAGDALDSQIDGIFTTAENNTKLKM